MRRPALAAAALIATLLAGGCAASTTAGSGSVASPDSTSRPAGSSNPAGSSVPAGSTSGSESATTLDPLTGRQTALALEPSFIAALAALRIAPAVVGRARLQATAIGFPITGGRLQLNGSTATGSIEHTGSGLSLTSGAITLTLENLVVDYDASVVRADILANGATAATDVRIMALDVTAQKQVATGTGQLTLTGASATLTADAAALFNAAFRTTAIKLGTPVGVLTVVATG